MEEQNINVLHETQSQPTEQSQQIIQPETSSKIQQSGTISVEYAGFWVRFAASLVDALVLAIPALIMNIIFRQSFERFLATNVLIWAYAIYMLHTKQATFGKMAVGLNVTTIDGNKPTLGKLVLREIIGKTLDGLTIGIGYLIIMFSGRKQALHDKIANTVVVYDPTRKKRTWIVILAIIISVGILAIGILAKIILVSTNSMKEKADQSMVAYEEERIINEIKVCKLDGGNVNAYQVNNAICDAPYHGVTWPDTSSLGYKLNAPAAENAALATYSFILSKEGAPNIVCSLAEGNCK